MKTILAATLYLSLLSLNSHSAGPANEFVKFSYLDGAAISRTGIISIEPQLVYTTDAGVPGVFKANSKQAYNAIDNTIKSNSSVHIYSSAIVYPDGVKDGEYKEVSLQLGNPLVVNPKEITIKDVISVYIESSENLLSKLTASDTSWAKAENQHEIDRIEQYDNGGGVCSTTFYSHAPEVVGTTQIKAIKSIISKKGSTATRKNSKKDAKDIDLAELIATLKKHKIVLTSRCDC